MSKKLTTEDFINKACKIHNNKYGYDSVIYVNCKTKIKIYCKACNEYFFQEPRKHLEGRGCPNCSAVLKIQNHLSNTHEFIKKAMVVHRDKYNYDQVEYKRSNIKVKIWCKQCKKYFYQTPNSHLAGHGCTYCCIKNNQNVIEKFRKIHGDDFYYGSFEYKGWNTKSIIYCKKCKQYFLQTPLKHARGQGCPYCKQSKSEKYIKNWFINNNIKFETQKRFTDCRDKNPLPFDFYLPDYNLCIEFQGQQHFEPHMFISLYKSKEKGMEKFEQQKYRDQIKQDYCKVNNIKLIEITYKDNIEEKLKDLLS